MYRNPSSPFRVCFALAFLLLSSVSVRADLIQWGYNWEPGTTKIAADGGSSGYLALTDEASKAAAGNSNTVVTNLHAFSTASSIKPDTFTQAAYSFTLQLEDLATKTTGSLTFSGFFSGAMAANSANIKNTVTSPTTQQITLGGTAFTVALGTYTPPGPPGATNAGSLNAVVSVAAAPGNGHTSSTPEPSTLVLASLALPFAGMAGWRKRKNRTLVSDV
jgi:hypothetical protein